MTVGLGVLTAAYVSFGMPALDVPGEVTDAGIEGQNVVRWYGWVAVLLAVVPALVAAAPLVLPAKTRGWVAAAGAAVLTVFVLVSGNLGLYYFPVALMLWAATIVPWVLRRGIGRAAARAWHLTAAVFLTLPALLIGSAVFHDTVEVTWPAVVLWGVLPLVLAVLCACGMRAGYAVTAVAGALVMVTSLFDQGLLFAAFWLFAAVYLTIGASGFTATRPGQTGAAGRWSPDGAE
ncbi:hypothetical protein [Actinoplanes subglobosus]|uniref:Uncharacterized protein n=1 Tax=Actinoplanes subglobosus TaxID=1547892 RepID=A0ABV8IWK3_9ACTN